MNLEIYDQYQEQAARFAARYDNHEFAIKQFTVALIGELGELFNIVKKWTGHGHELDKAKLQDEAGDVVWYVANLCHLYGYRMSVLVNLSCTLTGVESMDEDDLANLSLDTCLQIVHHCGLIVSWQWMNAAAFPASLAAVYRLLAELLRINGLALDDCLAPNIAKLKQRYGTAFSAEASIGRAVYDG